MRITFVLPYAGMSGGNRVISIYAERLHRRGHAVTIVSLPLPRLALIRKIARFLRGRGWHQDMLPEPSWFEGMAMPHHILDTARPVVDADVPDADVVIATFWMTGPWVTALSEDKGAKAIFLQGHEVAPGEENPELDAAWRLPLRKIVISDWLARLARERFGDPQVYVVPNSVDRQQFYAPSRGKQQRPTVGIVYAPHRSKGFDVGLVALDLVRQRLPNLRVIAFGAHHNTKESFPGWIEFHYRPPQREIRALYAACDAWICSSRREGFYLPILEAMACGCPVVSTRIGGASDLIRNGENGFVVEVDDAVGLSTRVLDVLTLDEARWRSMSATAIATTQSYSWDDATDLFEQALISIAAERALAHHPEKEIDSETQP